MTVMTTQVLVVGGGPAGATVATLLAREGFEVTLFEREIFPRYHIGESLLPSILEVCDLLGVREKVEAHGFTRNYGGYFAWGRESWPLDFEPLRHPYGFQVIRSEFDQLLLEHARSQGVTVVEGTEIRDVRFDGDRPRVATWSREIDIPANSSTSFDYLVDASGRAGLLAVRYRKTGSITGPSETWPSGATGRVPLRCHSPHLAPSPLVPFRTDGSGVSPCTTAP